VGRKTEGLKKNRRARKPSEGNKKFGRMVGSS
jgi:hypothetical protein